MKGPDGKHRPRKPSLAETAPAAATPVLTARQAELLLFCVEGGYYRIPRRLTLRQLSAQLGISATSLSLALRRAEAKVMCHHAALLAAQVAAAPTPRRLRTPVRQD